MMKCQQASFDYEGFAMLLYTWQEEEIKENVSLLRVLQTLLPTIAWNDEGVDQVLALADANCLYFYLSVWDSAW